MQQTMASAHKKYMKEVLVPEIVGNFKNENFESIEIESMNSLDGFMSALYNLKLRTSLNGEKSNIKERIIIVKFMKGDETFRESTKSYTLFANEIFIYDKVLQTYGKLIKLANVTDVSEEDWVAHCYVAKFGFVDGLSTSLCKHESVLALENLKPHGYVMGPHLYLDRDHLMLMANKIAQFHSMSYILRQYDEQQFEALRSQIIPLSFISNSDADDAKNNLFIVLYRVAFDRFFDYYDRMTQKKKFDTNDPDDRKLIENLHRLRERYFEQPTLLLEKFRTDIEKNVEDRPFGVIMHGDYNRNNVMFRYQNEKDSNNLKVADVKLIDFQELRYGSPALDVSFFLFLNTPEDQRSNIWIDILKTYHTELYKMIEKTLRGLQSQKSDLDIPKALQQYSFDKFNAHFSRFAFYGVMVCLHFLPWLLGTESECSEISHHLETDMHSNEFYKIAMSAGGDDANECVLNVVRFASKMGYMDYL